MFNVIKSRTGQVRLAAASVWCIGLVLSIPVMTGEKDGAGLATLLMSAGAAVFIVSMFKRFD